MVGSPFPTTARLAMFDEDLQEGKRGAGGLGGMAMVCCDWQLQLPPGAFLVCSKDPSNVMNHCHNNGWLSFPNNSPFGNV